MTEQDPAVSASPGRQESPTSEQMPVGAAESGAGPPEPTPVTLTDEQRYFFEAQGYLVVRDALSAADLARVRAAADAAEARWRADATLPGVRRHDLEQVLGILEYDPMFCAVLENPRILPLVRDLLGPDVMVLDHDYFLTPPGTTVRHGWHYDESFPGVYHPLSRLLLKVFYVLQDIPPDGGATLILPGSHRFPPGVKAGNPEVPEDLPAAVGMALPAGAAYLMSGRAHHSAGSNASALYRKLLIFTYGHKWMRVWDKYEPSAALAARAMAPMSRQLLGLTDPYGPNAPIGPKAPNAPIVAAAPMIASAPIAPPGGAGVAGLTGDATVTG